LRAMIFDLDGTLIDSAYVHALAWQASFRTIGWVVPAWELHRLVGMGGDLLANTVARARGHTLTAARRKSLESTQADRFLQRAGECAPLPGAMDLLVALADGAVPHGIATSGKKRTLAPALEALKLPSQTRLVTGDDVKAAKPEPDLFLACQKRLRIPARNCVVVGDAVWDIHAARRSGIPAVGLLTGGFGEQELHNAGAMRVYRDLEDLHRQIDQLGIEL
jgi:HAD superfamily hydrolase (TIGR01549 family)